MTEAAPDTPSSVIDTTRPHPARLYDWYLGGKDNYPVDEELGRKLLAVAPGIPLAARQNRAFMHRSTRWLAERGVRQYLDIGTGIPTEPNLHRIAQESVPGARVVYCDNDPIVLAHAGALLDSTPEGSVDFVQADARDTDTIIERAAKTLDFGEPVALSLIALLHFLSDEDGAGALVDRLVSALAPGSYLTLSNLTGDFAPKDMASGVTGFYKSGAMTMELRDRARFTAFFDGLELVAPGVVVLEDWHPELGEVVPAGEGTFSAGYAAIARKP
ncbi:MULTISPECIES: SAM-dependent methyltransferase [unclassified Streptomyces]|uniref:SAM-dependent methyltransferase n=1 Tax=Streptomyces evansiae TaxID=3075535 RepID=A0ABU2QUI1_9ACTN|nr:MULTISPECIES: SAM-dependent methyltransferase [unclassified Streptomyces]MDT0407643.1 SAM-dependent methyltransferase [Streptomyces sp. DSM 41979]MDT0421340.1 SAM-dependent methyltransferase [Streptomyces sp. DSM 41859]WEH29328.1 SAM-dependent methyltransferase [Streptomyces sp. AM 3-1-1]SCD46826.1 S-adenosyl methyltransferase [Streptomyces sp. DfronAA-171]